MGFRKTNRRRNSNKNLRAKTMRSKKSKSSRKQNKMHGGSHGMFGVADFDGMGEPYNAGVDDLPGVNGQHSYYPYNLYTTDPLSYLSTNWSGTGGAGRTLRASKKQKKQSRRKTINYRIKKIKGGTFHQNDLVLWGQHPMTNLQNAYNVLNTIPILDTAPPYLVTPLDS